MIFDLGLVRQLGYYTGAVFEVYDPAVGFALGGGGRYDDLLGRFGRELPACGIALDVQRVHLAQAAEEALAVSAPLTIAVPRGALFGGTLDLLDRLVSTPREVRSNDRKLLFAEAGIVTMRPSDVPTYVEHGVGRPRHHRQGRAGRAVAPQRLRAAGPRLRVLPDGGGRRARRATRSATRCGGSGRVRIATKYPRAAAAYFADTGRQAEMVEVKGSVELAPLTGLADGDRRPDRHRPHPRRRTGCASSRRSAPARPA